MRIGLVGSSLKDNFVPAPCHEQVQLSQDHVAQSSIKPDFEHLRIGNPQLFWATY